MKGTIFQGHQAITWWQVEYIGSLLSNFEWDLPFLPAEPLPAPLSGTYGMLGPQTWNLTYHDI